MDVVQAVSGYITKMVTAGDGAATGTSAAKMKILLLDNETVGLSSPSKGRESSYSRPPGLYCVFSNDPVCPSGP